MAFEALSIHDLREMARRRLPKGVFEFIERGSDDDLAIARNRMAYQKYLLRPRILRDVSSRTLATELFGHSMAMPVVMAPTGAAGLAWHDGEVALARAAAAAGLPFTLSTLSLTSIERIAAEAPGWLWFQLYMWPDRSMSHDLVERVRRAGFDVLVVTVDSPVPPNRESMVRNGFTLPFRPNRRNFPDIALHPRWFATVILRYLLTTGMPRFENFPAALQRSLTDAPKGSNAMPKTDSLKWTDFRELRRIWQGPLLVKGILHPEDAQAAAEHGADGIIVSNHGGRNLDVSIPPLFALPEILDRVGGRIAVLMDGGITRGSDMMKALALGANAVMIGRAPLWGVAAGGERGAARAFAILAEEALRVLGQCGCCSVYEFGRDLLWTETHESAQVSRMATVRAIA